MKAAFTTVELLVVLAILTVLAVIAIPASSRVGMYAARTKAISNMRQIGVAAHLYANDHNQQLPGQPGGSSPPADPASDTGGLDQWPKLFCDYLSPSDPRVFLDSTDPTTAKLPLAEVISNAVNNTGFVYNGFDELGSDQTPPSTIPLNRLDSPSQVVLLAQKVPATNAFYVDLLLQPLTNLLGLLNTKAYDSGAYYLYVDGSVRFTKATDYTNQLWLVDKTISLPTLPLPLPLMEPGRLAAR